MSKAAVWQWVPEPRSYNSSGRPEEAGVLLGYFCIIPGVMPERSRIYSFSMSNIPELNPSLPNLNK